MPQHKKPSQRRRWKRVTLSSDGKVFAVRYTDMSAIDLMNLFYAALIKIPHASKTMELALEKFKKESNGSE